VHHRVVFQHERARNGLGGCDVPLADYLHEMAEMVIVRRLDPLKNLNRD
jgi:hypothetical protein